VLSPALVAICLGYFMVILDTTIVTVALPALRQDLHATLSSLQWVVDGYTLTFAASLLTGGTLSDRLGARRVFQLGLGLFVLTSAGCSIAQTSTALIGVRLAQGVAAALLVPASLALLRANYADTASRARAVGVWGGIAGIGAAGGPILGGLLVSALSWRWVFIVNVPIGLLAAALTARYVRSSPRQQRTLDVGGQLAGILALTTLTWALIEVMHDGVGATVIAAATVSMVTALAFVMFELRGSSPMLPMSLFSHPVFSAGTAIGLLINLGFYGQLFAMMLYLQHELGYSPLVAGLALLPEGGFVAIASLLSGRFTARAGGPARTMFIGLIIGGLGLLGLTIAGPDTPYAMLVLPLAAAGFGMAFTMPAATTAVVDNSPAGRAGAASGAINSARQIGGVIGVALLGGLVGEGSLSISGLRFALAAASGAFFLGAVLAAFAGSWLRRKQRARAEPAG
jgi:DHA2 family methylenomycin A resistance protein-like MFS transporter